MTLQLLRIVKENPFYRFLFIAISCYLCWFFVYDLYLREEGSIDFILGSVIVKIVVGALRILNYDAYYQYLNSCHYFFNGSQRILKMVPACNGQVLYPLFAGFILAAPGFGRDKWKFITLGCIVIFMINVLRVLALCLLKINAPQYLAFNHKYTFALLMYACIFIMWVLWIKYFVPRTVAKTASVHVTS